MDLSATTLIAAASWFVVFVFSTTLHEAGHAFAALRLGDSTAYRGGQVSLNPLPHIRREPVGMVVVPLVSFFLAGWMFGWASAPYDPRWAHDHPRKSALMAAAGPAANLLLFILATLTIRGGLAVGLFEPPTFLARDQLVASAGAGAAGGAATIVSVLFSLNLILFVFNLLPLPPLDGSSVIQLFMGEDTARTLQGIFRQPMVGWMGILIAWQFFGNYFAPIDAFALSLLYPH